MTGEEKAVPVDYQWRLNAGVCKCPMLEISVRFLLVGRLGKAAGVESVDAEGMKNRLAQSVADSVKMLPIASGGADA